MRNIVLGWVICLAIGLVRDRVRCWVTGLERYLYRYIALEVRLSDIRLNNGQEAG